MKLVLSLLLVVFPIANSGVLKSSEDHPISHGGAFVCGETKCPDNQRCEMPTCDSEDEEDCRGIEAVCVPIPPPLSKCKEHEELKLCGSSCEPSCDQPEVTNCEEKCLTNVCQCKPGYVRDSSNECRLKRDCEKCFLECPDGGSCEKVDLPCEKKPCKTAEICFVATDPNEDAAVTIH